MTKQPSTASLSTKSSAVLLAMALAMCSTATTEAQELNHPNLRKTRKPLLDNTFVDIHGAVEYLLQLVAIRVAGYPPDSRDSFVKGDPGPDVRESAIGEQHEVRLLVGTLVEESSHASIGLENPNPCPDSLPDVRRDVRLAGLRTLAPSDRTQEGSSVPPRIMSRHE